MRAKLADGLNEEDSEDKNTSSDEEKKKKEEAEKKGKRNLDDFDYSSGIESDNDVDLLVEQEVLHSIKLKKEQ